MTDHIKLHIPGENFWAIPQSEDTAIIDNCLADDTYAYGDLVRFDADHNVTELIKRNFVSANAMYYVAAPEGSSNEVTMEVAMETYGRLHKYLQDENGIEIEGQVPGRIGLAIPVDMTAEKFVGIIQGAPSPLRVFIESKAQPEE
jgi:hypothetical protein